MRRVIDIPIVSPRGFMTAMEFVNQLDILCKRADDEIDVQYETHSLISRRIVRVGGHVKARYLYNVRNRRERPVMSTLHNISPDSLSQDTDTVGGSARLSPVGRLDGGTRFINPGVVSGNINICGPDNIRISDGSENEILISTGGTMGDVRVSSDSDIRVTSVQGSASFESDTAATQ